MIYRAVDVCRTCYITYSLMQEYFNEFHDMIQPTSKKWLHSEKFIKQESQPPIVSPNELSIAPPNERV